MKIRIKFKKWGAMKFVGHLDMMRYFQRAIRRAGINICYSEGYSPHQIMSFAAPLGVGITSDGEYFDIEVNETDNTENSIQKLNEQMVEGIEIIDYRRLPDSAKTAMSIVSAAEYTLSYKEGYKSPYSLLEWTNELDKCFFSQPDFKIIKKTKKSEKELDLKSLVYSLSVTEAQNKPVFHMCISTGSSDNIKPELVLESIYDRLNLEFDERHFQIHRVEVYTGEAPDQFIPLSGLGEVIS